jgi:hypothetical protein
LQNLNYYFSELAFLTIESETVQRSNGKYYFSTDTYSQIISNIETYGNYLITDFNSWSYCASSKIVNQNVLPVWTLSSPKSIVYENLLNLVLSTLSEVRST